MSFSVNIVTIILTACIHDQHSVDGRSQPVTITPSPPASRIPCYDCSAPRVFPDQLEGAVCTSTYLSFFYNQTSELCEPAGEIGCGRTRNNFPDLATCERFCVKTKDKDIIRTSPVRPRPPERIDRPLYNCSAPPFIFENQPESVICISTHPSYFYNATAEECQDAGDIGCGRTENNFVDIETCEKYCLPQKEECTSLSCPWYLWKHYTEQGCTPVYEEGKCCPINFDCPPLELNATHCIHRGQIYETHSTVESVNVCETCTCLPGDGEEAYARVSCATIECPEAFGIREEQKEGCRFVREPGKCCRVEKCEPEVNIKNRTQTLCTQDGTDFREGDTIDFLERPCHNCICNKDYNGTDGPGCYEVRCGFDTSFYYLKRSCTPKYNQDSCCAINWVCHPDDYNWITDSEVCKLPLDTGLSYCEDFKTRYYYDNHLGRCQSFNYTGCVGNMNNFLYLDKCESLCEKPDLCALPPVTEKCSDSEEVTKYYYDVKTGDCKPFTYGGCEANGNIFDSVDECFLKCGVQIQEQSNSQVEVCQMKADKGPCGEEVTRYAFNSDTNQCEPFTYGNCKGNGNNFGTEEDCLSYCGNKTVQGLSCAFGQYQFPVGHKIKTEDACLSCTCETPPLFTCVKKGCYPPKDPDYLFCDLEEIPGECCPKFNCFKTMDEVCKFFNSCDTDEDCNLSGPSCLTGQCSLICKKKNQGSEGEDADDKKSII